MDDPDGPYAPQSPDLSAYHSSYAPEQSANAYYASQQPPYTTSYHPPTDYHPHPYAPQMPSPASNQYLPSKMERNGQIQHHDSGDNPEWVPNMAARGNGRKTRKDKYPRASDKLAPGVAEGIEVKTKFPVARIKRIMQADEDVGKVSQATPTAVSKALELFMISVVGKAAQEAKAKSSKRVTAAHLKQAVEKDEQLDFLATIIAKVPDTSLTKKDEDSEETGDGKKRRSAPRKRKKEPDDF